MRSVIYKVSELDLSRAMRKEVFKGHHIHDSHHIDLGTFYMAKGNVVAIAKTFMYLPWSSE